MKKSAWFVATFVALAMILVSVPLVQAVKADNAVEFKTAEKGGGKIWEGEGTINTKDTVTIHVVNTLNAEHGFAIDTMKVKEMLKPGEEKTITVKPEDIDETVKEHKVYCQLHPKHGAATLKVKK
jgi:hypothetical protein